MITDKINGGRSRAVISLDENSKRLRCELLLNGFTHPFCAMTYQKPGDQARLDASEYEFLSVTVEYKSDFHDTMLIYLLNDEGEEYQRANMRPVNVKATLQTYRLPVTSFFVPSWWVLLHSDDPLEGKTNMNNVTGIQFSSGDATQARNVEITVHDIAFHGKYLTKEKLYFLLLLAWAIPTLGVSLYSIFRTRNIISKARQRANALQESNTTLEKLNTQLDLQAKTDPLTGALNRAGLDELITGLEHAAANRGTLACSVILLDVDNFKHINDTYGHSTGDTVLNGLVARLREKLRKTDELIRFGGEEFMILCRYTSSREAMLIAEKCRKHIQSQKIGELSVTCSFGVAQGAAHEVNKIIECADKALYQAKNHGKNRVVSAE